MTRTAPLVYGNKLAEWAMKYRHNYIAVRGGFSYCKVRVRPFRVRPLLLQHKLRFTDDPEMRERFATVERMFAPQYEQIMKEIETAHLNMLLYGTGVVSVPKFYGLSPLDLL